MPVSRTVNSCIIMHKMRKRFRPIMLLSALRGAILAVVTTYVIMPLTTSAASGPSIRVCSAAGDACSNFVNKYINPFILLLTALVGVGAVISIVVAGIQYSASGDDPNMIG